MKITIIVASYWPCLDGVQMVTQYHAEGLAKKGHQVTVLTSKMPNTENSEIHNGVLVERMDAYNRLYWHFGNRKAFERRIIKAGEESDVILAVCLQSYAADWMLGVMDQVKCRKVLYMHGMPDFKLHREDCSSLYNVAKTLFRNIRWKYFYTMHWKQIKKFDAVVHLFENDNSFSYFSSHNYQKNYPIENSCEDVFFEKTTEYGRYFLYVGNYCQRKNQISALRNFYKAKDDDFEIVFIGGRENDYCKLLKKENERLSSQYGKNKAKILYGLDRSSVINYTQKAYATILSSTYEYYPIVIVESMAAGVPFISTDVGIVRLLPGGIIVRNDLDMIYWIEKMQKSSSLRGQLGQIGRNYALNHMKMDMKVAQLESVLKGDARRIGDDSSKAVI